MEQKTIQDIVSFEGIGIHSGVQEKIICYPAQSNQGIIFESMQTGVQFRLGSEVPIKTDCATVFEVGGWRLSTVEHFVAACGVLGIDNLKVLVEGNEVPILDGSAEIFCLEFMRVGIKRLMGRTKKIRFLQDVYIVEGDQSILVSPYARDAVVFEVVLTRPYFIEQKEFKIECLYGDTTHFFSEIISARTFGDFSQWEYLKSRGLALGATIDSLIVWKDGLWMQELRWKDEPIRHKVLDCFGDIFLLGGAMCARITVKNPGHSLHQRLIAYLKTNKNIWMFD